MLEEDGVRRCCLKVLVPSALKKKKIKKAFRLLSNISELQVSLCSHQCSLQKEKTGDSPAPVLGLDTPVQISDRLLKYRWPFEGGLPRKEHR